MMSAFLAVPDFGIDLGNHTVHPSEVACESRVGELQENPILDRDRLRQIKRHLASLVQAVGRGAIGARLLTRELQLAGFQQIRHATSIA